MNVRYLKISLTKLNQHLHQTPLLLIYKPYNIPKSFCTTVKVPETKQKLQDLSDDDELQEIEDIKRLQTEKKKATTLEVTEDQVFHKKQTGFWVHAKVAAKLFVKGCKDINRDFWYLKELFSGQLLFNSRYTALELRERRRISKDILKFIPFFLLCAIPAGELLLPLWVGIFPNATPTQFIMESELGKRLGKAVDRQEKGYSYLAKFIPRFVCVLGIDPIHFMRVNEKFNSLEGEEKDFFYHKANVWNERLMEFAKEGDHSEKNLKDILINN